MRFVRLFPRVLAAVCAAVVAVPVVPVTAAELGLMTVVSRTQLCRDPSPAQGSRTAQMSNHGGDIAFEGARAVIACGADDGDLHNDGFVLADISDPAQPRAISRFACVASASDVGLWGDLVFLAVDRNNDAPASDGPAGEDCAAPVVPRTPVTEGQIFQGLRIVSIANPVEPVLVRSIRTNVDGTHNLTVVPDLKHSENGVRRPRVVVFAAGAANVDDDPDPTVNTIDTNAVVSVPLDDPGDVTVHRATVGAHGGCHDISVFLPRGLAACNRTGSGTLIWDIRDDAGNDEDDGASLTSPTVVSYIVRSDRFDPLYSHHSSAWSWDGRTLVVSDENLPALANKRCAESPDAPHGALWFFDVSKPDTPVLRGHVLPPPGPSHGWCSSKQFNIVPTADGDDIAVVSWMGGGVSVVDFTMVNHPDKARRKAARMIARSTDLDAVWAAHWYNGYVYVNNAYGCFSGVHCLGDKDATFDVYTVDALAAVPTVTISGFNFALQECLPAPHWKVHGADAICAPKAG